MERELSIMLAQEKGSQIAATPFQKFPETLPRDDCSRDFSSALNSGKRFLDLRKIKQRIMPKPIRPARALKSRPQPFLQKQPRVLPSRAAAIMQTNRPVRFSAGIRLTSRISFALLSPSYGVRRAR